jgi:hypothetical protein
MHTLIIAFFLMTPFVSFGQIAKDIKLELEVTSVAAGSMEDFGKNLELGIEVAVCHKDAPASRSTTNFFGQPCAYLGFIGPILVQKGTERQLRNKEARLKISGKDISKAIRRFEPDTNLDSSDFELRFFADEWNRSFIHAITKTQLRKIKYLKIPLDSILAREYLLEFRGREGAGLVLSSKPH